MTARYGAGTSTGTPIATSRAALGMGVASVYRAVQRMARHEQQSFLEGELSDAELGAVAARYRLADVDLTDRGNIATLRDLAADPTNALALYRLRHLRRIGDEDDDDLVTRSYFDLKN